MIEKLKQLESRFDELTSLIVDPSVIGDRATYRKYTKEHSELEPLVRCFREFSRVERELQENKELVQQSSDAELRELALAEVAQLEPRREQHHRELLVLLLPKDPNDAKNTILEIRAGTGGDEAALFAGDLFNMYSRFADTKRFRVEVLSSSEANIGGFKEVIARIEGHGAFSQFKYESGVHRVQRVPQTETQGRIHTSTVTVAVLPEAEEVDVQLNDKDLRIDVFRSSGPGGQSVNTTDSAVRVTHIPSGLVVSCQDEKSQHKNKAKALMVLRSRLLAQKQAEQDEARRDERRGQIGSGERAEKIRTYNFPQSRVTDHRIGLTLYQLDAILTGKMEGIVEPLVAHYQAEALQKSISDDRR